MSPVFTFGRFFFVAPSNARYEREAGSLVPMSTLKYYFIKKKRIFLNVINVLHSSDKTFNYAI